MVENLLSMLLFLPLAGAAAVALARDTKAARAIALAFTLIPLLLTVPLVQQFVHSFGTFNQHFQFAEKA
ncbi:MAG: dehydrogenase, partial [Halobacteria archaeon]